MFNVGDHWSYINFAVAIIVLLYYTAVIFLFTLSTIASKLYFHKKISDSMEDDDLPGISIIKPMAGLQPHLEKNLESHFRLNYPKFELLFCFHDNQDEALALLLKVKQKFTNVDVKIFISGSCDIVNPMVQNMAPGYEAAKYDNIWISSSRVEATNESIRDMIIKLQKPDVSLVHQMPYVSECRDFDSFVEKIYFGAALAKAYIAFNMLGICCIVGMSYMFKKSWLDQVNGLSWYGRYLSEDFYLSRALHKKGKIVMSAYPARQMYGQTTLGIYHDRMIRWLRLRLTMTTFTAAILEPISDCFPLGAMVTWALLQFLDFNPFHFIIFHVMIWLTFDYILITSAENGSLDVTLTYFCLAWLVRELSATYIYIVSVIDLHHVKWGQKTFYVQFGGLVSIVPKK